MTDMSPITRLKNGPELWDLILDRMPAGSVIAGGAVRDFLIGVQPKDVDVFMGIPPMPEPEPLPIDDPLAALEAVIGPDPRAGLYRIDNMWERQEEYSALNGIDLVSSGLLYGYRVDAIVMTDFEVGKLIDGFDFGLTRCFYDGVVHARDECLADIQNKTVTLLLTDRLERSRARFERFNARMGGGWTLVEPQPPDSIT